MGWKQDQADFEAELEAWAKMHWPECAKAINSKDDAFRKRCLGAIVRKRATEDVTWLWRMAQEWPTELIRLSPWVGKFTVRALEIPAGDWTSYVGWLNTGFYD